MRGKGCFREEMNFGEMTKADRGIYPSSVYFSEVAPGTGIFENGYEHIRNADTGNPAAIFLATETWIYPEQKTG